MMMRGRVLVLLVCVGAKLESLRKQPHRLGPRPVKTSAVKTRGGGTASSALTLTESMLAGAMARMLAQFVLHPLDVARTRTQVKDIVGGIFPPEAILYGIIPQMVFSAPAGATQFAVINFALTSIERHLGSAVRSMALSQLLAAAFATFCAASVRVPQELLKQTCMAGIYKNVWEAVVTLWAKNGLFAFYKGARATVVRDILWNALSFTLFQVLSKASTSSGPGYFRGIFCGSAAALMTHPLDVVKTRTMTGAGAATGSLFAQLKALVDSEGPAVLAKGLLPRICYLGPLASLVLATNELVAQAIIKARKPVDTKKK